MMATKQPTCLQNVLDGGGAAVHDACHLPRLAPAAVTQQSQAQIHMAGYMWHGLVTRDGLIILANAMSDNMQHL